MKMPRAIIVRIALGVHGVRSANWSMWRYSRSAGRDAPRAEGLGPAASVTPSLLRSDIVLKGFGGWASGGDRHLHRPHRRLPPSNSGLACSRASCQFGTQSGEVG